MRMFIPSILTCRLDVMARAGCGQLGVLHARRGGVAPDLEALADPLRRLARAIEDDQPRARFEREPAGRREDRLLRHRASPDHVDVERDGGLADGDDLAGEHAGALQLRATAHPQYRGEEEW